MKNSNITNGDTFPQKVKVNLDVLRAMMLDRIDGEVNGTDIVAVDQRT
jgi:hypothetical protein